MIDGRCKLAVLGAAVMFSAASVRADGQTGVGKDPIIGTWTLNVTKSTYVTGQAPKSSIRTFDYTRDGLILVTLSNVSAQGAPFFAHWYMAFDGKEYPEFQRASGDRPTLWISITPYDSRTKQLIGRRLEKGRMTITDRFTLRLSEDGKTLTVTYEDADGKPSGNVAVFDKQS
jgi:hypothetical protein